MKRRAVFLDRDGVINRVILRDGKPYPPASLAELELLPDAAEVCRTLGAAGFLRIVVTNQPDIARGRTTAEEVLLLNRFIQQRVDLDDVRVCPHDEPDDCACRKPKPGLIVEAAREWNIDLAESYIVGDRWRDIEAGQRAGCSAVFIDYGYRERRPQAPFERAGSLREAAAWILNEVACHA